MTLPTDDKARKALPIFDGCIMYFPDALLSVAEVSRVGNEQHNPGEPLHWARGKSMDQYNTAVRHLMDHRLGTRYDSGGERHLAKAAWRILAALQLDIEAEHREKIAEDMHIFGTGIGRQTANGVEHVPLTATRLREDNEQAIREMAEELNGQTLSPGIDDIRIRTGLPQKALDSLRRAALEMIDVPQPLCGGIDDGAFPLYPPEAH